MESIGARLKKLRLEKGLSLEEVHKQTKISLNVLKAIEEDTHINLNPIYIKGFIKIYCKLLKVDPRECLPDYKEPQSESFYEPKLKEEPPSFLKEASIKLVSLLPRIRLKSVFIVLLVIVSISGLFKLGKTVASKRQRGQVQEVKFPVALSESKIEKKAEPAKPKKAAASATIRLGIHSKDNCFVQIKSDGHTVFQGSLRKGMSENWQAKDKIELSLGNAGAVDLEINGKPISKLGRKGQAIRNILITKEGLTVPR